MLIFDDGEFSEDSTFLVSETFALNPVSAQSSSLTCILLISRVERGPYKELPASSKRLREYSRG